jgi:flagellar hook-associated protein 2
VTRSTNTFTIDGITYALKGTTGTPVSFSVERDVEAILTKIKDFVTAYNTLLQSLQSKISEEINKDYAPLTDEEKETLSEKQAEQWEAKAKSGILRNDSSISDAIQKMRNAFYTTVGSTGKTPADIGLGTGAYEYTGQIHIDEDRLRSALQSNPAEAGQLFAAASTATDPEEKFNASGLVQRLSGAMSLLTENVSDIALSTLEKAISQAETKADALQEQLQDNEDRYWTKFSAMETALSKMNSQMAWLKSQFASGESQ